MYKCFKQSWAHIFTDNPSPTILSKKLFPQRLPQLPQQLQCCRWCWRYLSLVYIMYTTFCLISICLRQYIMKATVPRRNLRVKQAFPITNSRRVWGLTSDLLSTRLWCIVLTWSPLWKRSQTNDEFWDHSS